MITSKQFSSVINDVVAALPLPADIELEGVFLAGSYAQDVANDRSDLDLYGITKGGGLWRKFYRAFDVDIDLFVLSESAVHHAIATAKPVLLTSIAEARILQDKNGVLLRLQRAVKERVAKGPLPLMPAIAQGHRHRLYTIIDDCDDCVESAPSTAIMLMAGSLKQLSELYFTSIGHWDATQKRTFSAIAKHNKDVAGLFELVAGETATAVERLAAYKTLVGLVLEPYGGVLRYFESRIPAAKKA